MLYNLLTVSLTFFFFFFFNDTATTEIYTLSLHDALPIAGRSTPSISTSPQAFSKLRASASASVGGRLIPDVFLDPHLAAEKNWGTYPFFDAAFLGGAALPVPLALTGMGGIPLLGFDANRYAGDAAVGGNAELRIAIGRFLALLPFRYGISGVTDVGRVFRAHIPSSTWHNGAGGVLCLAALAPA